MEDKTVLSHSEGPDASADGEEVNDSCDRGLLRCWWLYGCIMTDRSLQWVGVTLMVLSSVLTCCCRVSRSDVVHFL